MFSLPPKVVCVWEELRNELNVHFPAPCDYCFVNCNVNIPAKRVNPTIILTAPTGTEIGGRSISNRIRKLH
jgi:hypothetical protein